MSESPIVPRRRGRPPGSRNKPHDYSGQPVSNGQPAIPATVIPHYVADLSPVALQGAGEKEVVLDERQVAVASRRIVLEALCDTTVPLLKRAELGLRAVATFEGQRQSIWVASQGGDAPRTIAQLDEERQALDARLRRLLAYKDGKSTIETATVALQRHEVGVEREAARKVAYNVEPPPLPD